MTDGSDRRFDQSDVDTPAERGLPQAARLTLWRWVTIPIWSTAAAASLAWNIHLHHQGHIDQARNRAVGLLEKDMSARDLVAKLGGVYARIDRGAVPNPYLAHVPERDIASEQGVSLTLINSSDFMRLLHDGENERADRTSTTHVTSLRPLRAKNAPDAWEQRALMRFQSGATEVAELIDTEHGRRYRLMRPRYVEPVCLTCLGGQGFETGEVLGGVSVTVPVGEYTGAWHTGRVTALSVGHTFLWLLGIGGLVTGFGLLERRERELRRSAYYDPLTALPNRALLRDRLHQALVTAERHDHMGAVLFIDLDRFKTINDSLGHAVGDRLLQAVADCLRETVRATDTVARLGGDEFVVLLTELSGDAERAAVIAQAVAEKLLAAMACPFRIGRHELHTMPSIGIALFPMSVRHADEVLKQADTAMYQAKGAGGGVFHFYLPGMQLAAKRRLEIETDLHHALARRELALHFQPQVAVASGRIVGAEALIRWHHPRRGLITPGDFIPVAEETGIILAVGDWVLREACRSVREWIDQEVVEKGFRLAINVSPKQFRQWDFVERVATIVAETGIDAGFLELELTEGMFVDDVQDAAFKMACLIELGIRFAIDDFGTGYSSLMYLKRLPLEVLKIDRSFVDGVLEDANDAAIVETILAMAQRFGYRVVAEGVEHQAQLDFLRERGCNAYQGYHFSEPVRGADFVALARKG